MNNIVFLILIAQLIIIIALCVNTFKEQWLSFQLGKRRKTVVFIDVRESVRVTLSQDLKTFEYNGVPYTWNSQKERHGACVYVSSNSEPVDIEIDTKRCLYWCDSNEYHTNLKNKLLETLMMLKSKDQIIMLLFISLILSLIVIGLVWMKSASIMDAVQNVQNSVNALNSTSGIIIEKV